MIVNCTIILVEDSDSDRLLFSKYLKQIGYNCLCLDSAEKLIDCLDELECSIILMDIEMPGITGLEAAIMVREKQEKSGIKHIIIALTAHNDNNIVEIVAKAGFDDYLQKPITKQELKSKLSRYIKCEADVSASFCDMKNDNSKANGKLYSLDMFEADEPDFVRSIVEMFVENTPGSVASMKAAFEKDEMETLRQQAHKLKPHFSFFGAEGLQKTFQMIEDLAKENNHKEQLPDLINNAEKKILLMVEQMKSDILT